MRHVALIEKDESLDILLENDFLASCNNIILVCNDNVHFIEQNFIKRADIAKHLLLQLEYEQQRAFFEKMHNNPKSWRKIFIPKTPLFIKKYIRKQNFQVQQNLWTWLWPQYRKEYFTNKFKKYASVYYFLSIILLPRFSAFFAYAYVIKTKGLFLIKRKLKIKFSEAEFYQGLESEIDFFDPDIICCDSDRLKAISLKMNLCPVYDIEDLKKYRKVHNEEITYFSWSQ